MTTSRTWLPQCTSLMRQLGDGGKELAVGAGAEGVGAAGAVDAGVRDGAWAEAAVAGAGAKTGVGVGAEEAAEAGAGVEVEQELVLDPVETLSWICSDGPLAGEESWFRVGLFLFYSHNVFLFMLRQERFSICNFSANLIGRRIFGSFFYD